MVPKQFLIDIMFPCLLIAALCPCAPYLEHLMSRLHSRGSPCLLETVVDNFEKIYIAA